jgi:cardiolipin synthase
MWWIVLAAGVLVQLLGLWCAFDAVLYGRTPQGTIAWCMGLVVMPVVTVPLYLVLGARRFSGYVRARRKKRSALSRLGEACNVALAPWMIRPGPFPDLALDRLGLTAPTGGNALELLVNGEATFERILADIDRACEYVLIQFFIFRDDALGKKFEEAIARARGRGVRVCVLYDLVGTPRIARLCESLKAQGAEVHAFGRSRGPITRFQINFRNHRKVVVIDGHIAFVGGHNVGVEYLGQDKVLTPWRDTHMRMAGPAALACQLAFCEDWHWAAGAVPDVKWKVLGVTAEDGADPERARAEVLVCPTGPVDELETLTIVLLSLLTRATRRIWLTTPYFAPDDAIMTALQLAALRGVDVHILIPDKSDNPLVNAAAFTYVEELMPAGVRFHRYGKGFLHQKVILADDLAAVGSANLDNRSLRINFEIMAVTRDAGFVDGVQAMLETDLRNSREVTPKDIQKRRWPQRLVSRLARLLSPIL